jgi:hypothetical protein
MTINIPGVSLERKVVDGRCLYACQGDFRSACGGLYVDGHTIWASLLQILIEKNEGRAFLWRAVRGEQLDDVLATGSDIPGAKIGTQTYATRHLTKATEYGTGRAVIVDSDLEDDVCVMMYDQTGLKSNEANYEVTFLAEPKDCLKGVLMLRPIKRARKQRASEARQ